MKRLLYLTGFCALWQFGYGQATVSGEAFSMAGFSCLVDSREIDLHGGRLFPKKIRIE